MKEYMSVREFCKESGFPLTTMMKLVKRKNASEFAFKTSDKTTATVKIKTKVFMRMLDAGEFEEVMM